MRIFCKFEREFLSKKFAFVKVTTNFVLGKKSGVPFTCAMVKWERFSENYFVRMKCVNFWGERLEGR